MKTADKYWHLEHSFLAVWFANFVFGPRKNSNDSYLKKTLIDENVYSRMNKKSISKLFHSMAFSLNHSSKVKSNGEIIG